MAELKEKAAVAAQQVRRVLVTFTSCNNLQAQQLRSVKQQVGALAGEWQQEVEMQKAEVTQLQLQLLKEKELTEKLQQQQQQQQQQQALQLQHYTAARSRIDELEREVS